MSPPRSEDSDRKQSFHVGPLEHRDRGEVLDALRDAFGDTIDLDWFRWKHESGPWGVSRGWVARDADGLVGVRLLLPWEFRHANDSYRALRPCDTVTVPRARGMGVFTDLTKIAMAQVGTDTHFLFNTPNEQSRPGYLKMGFVDWATVIHRLSVLRPVETKMGPVTLGTEARGDSMRTAMTEEFLDWRYRRCPEHHYELFGIQAEDRPNGIVLRIRSWHGRRLMVVSELWGSAQTRRTLLRAAAARVNTQLAWVDESHCDQLGMSVRASRTVVTRRDLSAVVLPEPRLSIGDVEDVI